MKITIESTDKLVECTLDGRTFPARIWEGETASGVPVHCYVTRISVAEGLPAEDYLEFEEQLQECRKPTAAIQAIPLRVIL